MKIGAIHYLNAQPLYFGLQELIPDAQLSTGTPSQIAAQMRQHHIDVGIVPVAALPTLKDTTILQSSCIASRGAVRSVLLVSNVPPEQIRTLGLNTDSETSNALCSIILREVYENDPDCFLCRPDVRLLHRNLDAMVIIGDQALALDTSLYPYVLDLGACWTQLTGLPMVYAVWVGRGQGADNQVAEALRGASHEGQKNLQKIARRSARELGLSDEVCINYLEHNLHYKMGGTEWAAIELFLRKLKPVKAQPIRTGRIHHAVIAS